VGEGVGVGEAVLVGVRLGVGVFTRPAGRTDVRVGRLQAILARKMKEIARKWIFDGLLIDALYRMTADVSIPDRLEVFNGRVCRTQRCPGLKIKPFKVVYLHFDKTCGAC
jgi:hypothetical protein